MSLALDGNNNSAPITSSWNYIFSVHSSSLSTVPLSCEMFWSVPWNAQGPNEWRKQLQSGMIAWLCVSDSALLLTLCALQITILLLLCISVRPGTKHLWWWWWWWWWWWLCWWLRTQFLQWQCRMRSKSFIRVCVCVIGVSVCVCPHDRTKMSETTITKLAVGIVHRESWLPF